MSELHTKKFPVVLPKLDVFDMFSLALWFVLLVPVMQLPGAASYSFLRSVLFILWVAAFGLFIAIRVGRDKKLLFGSTKSSKWFFLAIGASVMLSYIFSASKIDSLFGFDLTFYSSALIGVSLATLYFLIRVAGYSLELSVSRLLATLPISLVIIDLLQVGLFFVPVSFVERLLGGYSNLLVNWSLPNGIYGNLLQAVLLHLIAVIILSWQIAGEITRNSQRTLYSYVRFGFFGVLSLALSYSLFATLSGVGLGIVLASLLMIGVAFISSKSIHAKKFAAIFSAVLVIAMIVGGIWWKFGFIGSQKSVSLDYRESQSIVQQSFQGSGVPLWRHLVGFGQGTFPYLYMKYRSLNAARTFLNDTFFFKPATYVGELYVENGVLGIIAVASAIIGAFLAAFRASAKASLIPETVLLATLTVSLLVMPSTLPLLVILFIVLASLFDKVETLPESLPTVHAVDIRVTSYTNRATSKVGGVMLVATVAYALVMGSLLFSPVMTMIGYVRSVNRYSVARIEARSNTTTALETYQRAYDVANYYKAYCNDCPQLSYVSLSTILGINDLFSPLTDEQRKASQELLRVRNIMMQSSSEILGKNSLRYDYWLATAQAYRAIATEDESTVLYSLAVQSLQNIVGSEQQRGINQYSVDALYMYTDLLMRTGNDTATNTLINQKLATLIQLVGTPVQVQFIQGIMLARVAKYDEAIKVFEGIKAEVEQTTSLNAEAKKQLLDLADKRIEDVKKLQSAQKSGTPVKTSVTVPPSPTTTSVPTVSSSPTSTPTATPTE